ncbi:hypothetical protein CLPUN_04530 [Clostridium puniceum]|uniref:Uncharacterized protein n=1 Tax=Clostridium puniceum TaxID=29367 RepID=A0A1S8TWQ7_9CLOT|nr:hypothetical protein [Clostridium puniceum]OOM82193.1 hypothetical protein CLPUN_04530 [Clostridium puniceum]
MKKIVLAVLATSMLLSNVAFASTKTTHTKSTQNSTISKVTQNNGYQLMTHDAN